MRRRKVNMTTEDTSGMRMSKQEEIRKWLAELKFFHRMVFPFDYDETEGFSLCENDVGKIISYLHSQGIRMPDGESLIEVD